MRPGLAGVLDCLRCPHCRAAFTRDAGSLRCAAGHVFDIARQGHVNLLGHAPGRNADSAQMVADRVAVLASGLFDPVSAALVSLVGPARTVVDAGAGPGHHLAEVVAATRGRGVACDVSPYACRRAAKQPGVGAVVADTWAGLPLADGCADAVLSVFAPRNWDEFARLAPVAVVASPRPEHLASLRRTLGLLAIDDDKSEVIDARAAAAGWHLAAQVTARLTRVVDAALAARIVGMGPNAFHAHRTPTGEQTVEIAVRVARYTR